MSLSGQNHVIAQSLLTGEAVDVSGVALDDLVSILTEVNDFLSHSHPHIAGVREVVDKATLEAVRRVSHEHSGHYSRADDLIFCMIGMSQSGRKTEAFETLFPHVRPQSQADLLNDLLGQLNDFSEPGSKEELTGLLAKHASDGRTPVTVADILTPNSVFTVGKGGRIVFRKGSYGPSPDYGFDP